MRPLLLSPDPRLPRSVGVGPEGPLPLHVLLPQMGKLPLGPKSKFPKDSELGPHPGHSSGFGSSHLGAGIIQRGRDHTAASSAYPGPVPQVAPGKCPVGTHTGRRTAEFYSPSGGACCPGGGSTSDSPAGLDPARSSYCPDTPRQASGRGLALGTDTLTQAPAKPGTPAPISRPRPTAAGVADTGHCTGVPTGPASPGREQSMPTAGRAGLPVRNQDSRSEFPHCCLCAVGTVYFSQITGAVWLL